VTLAACGSAAAAPPPPPPQDTSGVSQYRESVPTSKGQVLVGQHPKKKVASLPPKVLNRLHARGGADAKQLEQVATSAAYGAPARPAAKAKPAAARRQRERDALNRSLASPPSSLTAAAGAVRTTDSGGVGPLLLVAIFVTLAVAAAAIVRTRKRRPRPDTQ
jgi:hypothetical protein